MIKSNVSEILNSKSNIFETLRLKENDENNILYEL
jgi:hypothetical protein